MLPANCTATNTSTYIRADGMLSTRTLPEYCYA